MDTEEITITVVRKDFLRIVSAVHAIARVGAEVDANSVEAKAMAALSQRLETIALNPKARR